MTTKTVAYTPEQIAELTATYPDAPTADTVAALALSLGKSTKSVVAKLAQLGLYRKAEKAVGDRGQATKIELARRITPDEDFQADLVKLTKASLLKLVDLHHAAVKAYDDASMGE